MSGSSRLRLTTDASRANGLVRRLGGRYFVVLFAVAALVAVDQAIVQPLLVRLNSYPPAINVAGRQRMLSQKLTKAALALRAADDLATRQARIDELQKTLAQWSAAHAALRDGDPRLGVAKIKSADISPAWAELEPHFDAMQSAGAAIARRGTSDRAGPLDPTAIRDIGAIVDHEAAYLTTMERVVKLLEIESTRAVNRLRARALVIACTVIGLLVGLGWLVVRPATVAIRTQVDDLERRVAGRTAELAAANLALRREMFERQQADIRTRDLAAQLAHASRVSTMGHLTSGLAHELNQPLAAIVNYAETCELVLSEGRADPHVLQKHLRGVQQAALRAGQILRRVRNFVRPHADSRAEVDLHQLIEEVVALCRPEAARAAVSVSLDLADCDAAVLVDAIQIQQVLVNLLHNAIQAMEACPRDRRRLQIRTAAKGRLVQITVSDSGPALPADAEEHWFTPFWTTKTDGLGIGLSICRSIVEQHQGKIWLQSSPAPGATICFTLPRKMRYDVNRREQADCLCR